MNNECNSVQDVSHFPSKQIHISCNGHSKHIVNKLGVWVSLRTRLKKSSRRRRLALIYRAEFAVLAAFRLHTRTGLTAPKSRSLFAKSLFQRPHYAAEAQHPPASRFCSPDKMGFARSCWISLPRQIYLSGIDHPRLAFLRFDLFSRFVTLLTYCYYYRASLNRRSLFINLPIVVTSPLIANHCIRNLIDDQIDF
jgi:hypothetical protein